MRSDFQKLTMSFDSNTRWLNDLRTTGILLYSLYRTCRERVTDNDQLGEPLGWRDSNNPVKLYTR